MLSHQDNLHLLMSLVKYKPFLGVEYEPPHGCFRLVSKVFEEVYGIDLGRQDEGLEEAENKDRTARVQQKMIEMTDQVYDAQEGDVVVIRGRPFHIGIVIQPGQMIHSYNGGTSCIEDYRSIRWKNRVEGFYRYKGFSS